VGKENENWVLLSTQPRVFRNGPGWRSMALTVCLAAASNRTARLVLLRRAQAMLQDVTSRTSE
jgi:hypothetical protein